MEKLVLLPEQSQASRWRQKTLHKGELLPFSIPGLVSLLLREAGVAYLDNPHLVELATWEAVWGLGKEIPHFASIKDYPGFVGELITLFDALGHHESVLSKLTPGEAEQLELLYSNYKKHLANWHVLDSSDQLELAIKQIDSSQTLAQLKTVEIYPLGKLTPLHQQFIAKLATGRKVVQKEFPGVPGQVTCWEAKTPLHEVQFVASSIRSRQKTAGNGEIAVALIDQQTYLPLITRIFRQFGLKWQQPPLTLEQTPFAKAILALFQGEINGWHKQDLLVLTTPGWGIPVRLTDEDKRLLNLAPSLKGLAQWENYFAASPNWRQLCQFILSSMARFENQSIAKHCAALTELIETVSARFEPNDQVEQWSIYLKARDGFRQILRALAKGGQVISPLQFYSLLLTQSQKLKIQPPREFRESIAVCSIDQVLGSEYSYVYCLGMAEGSFPRVSRAHWLTKQGSDYADDELVSRLAKSVLELYLVYPENDTQGKMNLPSPLMPVKPRKIPQAVISAPEIRPRSHCEEGITDPQILQWLRDHYVTNGISVSKLNTYVRCPYQFYCQEVLKVDPGRVEEDEIDAAKEGSLIHRVLQLFWEAHLDQAVPAISKAEEEIVEIAKQVFAEANQSLSPRLARGFKNFVYKDLSKLPLGFRPRYLEHSFSHVTVDTPYGVVPIKGVIDRLDANAAGDYLLYDYKTGANPTLKEVLLGDHVQIPVYLLAASTLLPGKPLGAGFYSFKEAKISGFYQASAIKDLGVRKTRYCLSDEEWEEVFSQLKESLSENLHGILNGDFPVKPQNNQVCTYCPYQGICRRGVLE